MEKTIKKKKTGKKVRLHFHYCQCSRCCRTQIARACTAAKFDQIKEKRTRKNLILTKRDKGDLQGTIYLYTCCPIFYYPLEDYFYPSCMKKKKKRFSLSLHFQEKKESDFCYAAAVLLPPLPYHDDYFFFFLSYFNEGFSDINIFVIIVLECPLLSSSTKVLFHPCGL